MMLGCFKSGARSLSRSHGIRRVDVLKLGLRLNVPQEITSQQASRDPVISLPRKKQLKAENIHPNIIKNMSWPQNVATFRRTAATENDKNWLFATIFLINLTSKQNLGTPTIFHFFDFCQQGRYEA